MRIFEWVRVTFKEPQIARKFWVAFVGLLAYVITAYGIQVPEETLDDLTTLLFLLTAGGVWAVPNQNE